MIYFDNAATSWPKPDVVIEAMQRCIKEVGANPGRAGHRMAVEANRLVMESRELLAGLFNVRDPERIIFTINTTEALNLAIKGLLKPGDHVITSSMEHNSVSRPLHVLQNKGVEVTKVTCNSVTGEIELENIRSAVKENTRAIIIQHASNVTGVLMPVREIGILARERGLIYIVDAAQTAGVFDIDVRAMNIHLLAFPGHKSLLGPTGTGGLYIEEGLELEPLKEGGTGSKSDTPEQPRILPERYESGTLNTVGIAGLGAGIKYILDLGMEEIRDHELQLTHLFLEEIRAVKKIKVYGPCDIKRQAPVVSFSLGESQAGEIGEILDKNYDMACRAGLHCSPDAHHTLGTFDKKLIRFSFSYFNTKSEVVGAIKALRNIASKY